MRADDLMAAVFPKLVGCQENQTGPIEIPDHPIVRQTVYDCMHEAMDIDGLKDVLDRVEAGEIRLHAKDTTEPFANLLRQFVFSVIDDARRRMRADPRRAKNTTEPFAKETTARYLALVADWNDKRKTLDDEGVPRPPSTLRAVPPV